MMNQENPKCIGDPDYRVYIVGIGEKGTRIVQANHDALLELAIDEGSSISPFPPIIEFAYLTPEEITSSHLDCDYSFVVTDLSELNFAQQAALFNHEDLEAKFIISPDKPSELRNDVIWLNQANDEIVLKESIRTMIEYMLLPGYLCNDFLDLKSIMNPDFHTRKLHFSCGRATGSNQTDRITEATNKAWELIPKSVIKAGTGLLVIVKSGLDLEFSEFIKASEMLAGYFESIEDFNVLPGTILDVKMENEVEVNVIVSERVE